MDEGEKRFADRRAVNDRDCVLDDPGGPQSLNPFVNRRGGQADALSQFGITDIGTAAQLT
jgi:hypothetical protein